MSDRVLAIIRIGGRLDPAFAQTLIEAIRDAELFAREGDTRFEPRAVEDLVATLDDDGTLVLSDDSAPWGEMPSVTTRHRGHRGRRAASSPATLRNHGLRTASAPGFAGRPAPGSGPRRAGSGPRPSWPSGESAARGEGGWRDSRRAW